MGCFLFGPSRIPNATTLRLNLNVVDEATRPAVQFTANTPPKTQNVSGMLAKWRKPSGSLRRVFTVFLLKARQPATVALRLRFLKRAPLASRRFGESGNRYAL